MPQFSHPNVLNICEARHKAVAEESKARHLAVLTGSSKEDAVWNSSALFASFPALSRAWGGINANGFRR